MPTIGDWQCYRPLAASRFDLRMDRLAMALALPCPAAAILINDARKSFGG